MARVTPPDYETFREARRRAWDRWGYDGGDKLLGLLVTGQLQAWRPDKAGNVAPVPNEYWESDVGAGLLTASLDEIDKMRDLPVFLEKDLIKKIPSKYTSPMESRARRQAQHGQKEGGATAANVSPQTSSERGRTERPRRGRPPNAGIDDFWIEALRMVGHLEK